MNKRVLRSLTIAATVCCFPLIEGVIDERNTLGALKAATGALKQSNSEACAMIHNRPEFCSKYGWALPPVQCPLGGSTVCVCDDRRKLGTKCVEVPLWKWCQGHESRPGCERRYQ